MIATAGGSRGDDGRLTSDFHALNDARCVLDLVHLSRHTLGDRALETELLELFDRQAESAISRLTGTATVRGSAGADVAHMLKGSARAVGAFAVSAAAEQVEDALRYGHSPIRALATLTGAVVAARQSIAGLLG